MKGFSVLIFWMANLISVAFSEHVIEVGEIDDVVGWHSEMPLSLLNGSPLAGIVSECSCVKILQSKEHPESHFVLDVIPGRLAGPRNFDRRVMFSRGTEAPVLGFRVVGKAVPLLSLPVGGLPVFKIKGSDFDRFSGELVLQARRKIEEEVSCESESDLIEVAMDNLGDRLRIRFKAKDGALPAPGMAHPRIVLKSKHWKSDYELPVPLEIESKFSVDPKMINLGFVKPGERFEKTFSVSSASGEKKSGLVYSRSEANGPELVSLEGGLYQVSGLVSEDAVRGSKYIRTLRIETGDADEPVMMVAIFGVVPADCCGQRK